ncbi:SDR family oxidoreductase [uncultured Hoeflea sp.]|uniref:SDR family oxidoreductase n=1 Tax=uncultured Hoeflea sp. TaxID=538666 RepID=UPI0030DD7EE0
MGRLDGQHALVTAAGDGIGRAIAIALAAEGAHVIATSRREDKLKTLISLGIAEVAGMDVADDHAIATKLSTVDELDILINCAGIVKSDTVETCSTSELTHVMSLNLFGAYHVTKAALPAMVRTGGGSIINIASIISSLRGAPERFSYATSKGAVIGMTKSIATDFAHCGVRCNAICPGTIETPSLRQRISDADQPEQERQKYLARHPLGSLGSPEQVAALAVHLASDEAGFTTGQTFIMDGGWTA